MSSPGLRGTVLIVEDEAYVRKSLGELMRSRGFDVRLEESGAAALATLERTPVDVVVSDLRMPGIDGLELTRQIQQRFSGTPVILLTGHGTISSAVECVRAGATDYILKPADPDALEVAIERALSARELKREVEWLRRSAAGSEGRPEPIGESKAWQAVLQASRAAAAANSTVLLLGESGTGKELLARMIHTLGARSAAPFVVVSCGATPTEMWESEFFGHRKGAFASADSDREGRFRLAHRGTLFLDEVAAMPLEAQTKLLRVLEEGEFDRLGDQQPTRVDVRVIAATNSDLDTEVEAGRFRSDLFYRLNVLRLELPPLRDRDDDIGLLAQTFLREVAKRQGLPVPELTDEQGEELAAYSWPGNVRELRNVLERAVILSPGDALTLPDLPRKRAAEQDESSATGLNLRATLAAREKQVLIEALQQSGGVRKEAARLLGIDQRNLPYFLKKHKVDPKRIG